MTDGPQACDAPRKPLRIVTFTTLFPNLAQPTHGVFVENRLRHLVADGRVRNVAVIAPVPWFPASLTRLFPRYAEFASVPHTEVRSTLSVIHPRFPAFPKIGMNMAPAALFARCLPAFRRLQAAGEDFDVIDAHYFYPDGVAAVMIGNTLRKPVVITARGTDINLIPRFRIPRMMIRYAAGAAAGIVAVSQALKEELMKLGIAEELVSVLRNGVDLNMFRPMNRSDARAALGLRGPTLASVGALIDRKGHDLVIRALQLLPTYRLLIVGEGPDRSKLERLSTEIGVADRVHFLGRVRHDQLAGLYSAADALVLASSREGWPNVLLEAMACGTPVIASSIWGNPEIVTQPEAGLLMGERSIECVAESVQKLFADLPDRAATRRYAEKFSWDDTTIGQIRLFGQIVARQSIQANHAVTPGPDSRRG